MSVKTCTHCGTAKPLEAFNMNRKAKDGRASWCKDCTGKAFRAYLSTPEGRANHLALCKRYNKTRDRGRDTRIYKSRYPEKFAAVQKVGQAVWHGRIKRPDQCSECGASGIIQAHHDDYSKPYEVRWVCHVCHTKLHHQQKERV